VRRFEEYLQDNRLDLVPLMQARDAALEDLGNSDALVDDGAHGGEHHGTLPCTPPDTGYHHTHHTTPHRLALLLFYDEGASR